MNWLKGLKGKIRFKEYLKDHTTFKVGGPAEVFFQPRDVGDLKSFILSSRRKRVPLYILGAGSNLLVRDGALKGAVVHLNSADFKKILFRKGYVEAGSGVLLKDLIAACSRKGLSGFEFLSGVPGTVGGALVMNASAMGEDIASLVKKITVMGLNGRIKTLKPDELKFSYRASGLEKFVVLKGGFKLAKKDPRAIKAKIKEYLALRSKTQDYSYPSAGCVFKNPARDSAGRLIDLCGLKGKRIGGARVSEKHANFILNTDRAKAADILGIMDLMKKRVRQRFNLKLVPEIKIW